MNRAGGPAGRVLIAFAVIVVFLGVNFVAVRFSNRELPPFWGGTLRFALASALLFAVVAIRRLPLPTGRALVGAALFGALAFGLNFALIYRGLVHVPAAMASVIFSTIPLLTMAMAAVTGQERLRLGGIVGAVAALAGTAIIFFVQLRLNVPLGSLVEVGLAAVAAAASGVVVRGFPRSHPVSTNAVGMAVGAAMLAVATVAAGERPTVPALPATWIALGWLVASSTVAFVLMVWVLSQWTASAAAYSAVLSPLVTVAAGSVLAGESVSGPFVAGALVILAGVYIGAIAKPRVAATASTVEA